MFEMPAKRGGVWVDLGGGTGSNLEYFRGAGGEDTLSATFSKVYVVDLTPSLLEVAKARVEERGWGERVEAVLDGSADADAFSATASDLLDRISAPSSGD